MKDEQLRSVQEEIDMRSKPFIGILLSLLVAPAVALAQSSADQNGSDDNDDDATVDTSPTAPISTGTDDEGKPLPPPQSDNDKQPPVASPGTPNGYIVKQAGVGGVIGYGRAGVIELGGSAGFTTAPSFTSVNATPEVGWFVADNLELSGRVGFTYARTDTDAGKASGSITTAMIEPSYHLPFNKTTFGFLGMGMGAAYVSGPGMGFAVAPRLGANFMVGRSGVLTPSLSWQYTTHDTQMVGPNAELLVVSSEVMANVGYTVMW